MKKKLLCVLLSAVLLLSIGSVTALAADDDPLPGGTFHVSFTRDAKMESDFGSGGFDTSLAQLEPGDSTVITLELSNGNENPTSWYMTNKVLHSLEDGKLRTANGAYTYVLSYEGPGGTTVLFDSDTVGGNNSLNRSGEVGEVGLHEATGAMEDYFFLDTLNPGQGGRLTLKVALDGESQANNYQDTRADLQMNFAVELEANRRTTYVRTGDENDSFLYMGLMGGAGALVLLIAVYGYVSNKKKKGEGEK